MNVLGISFGKPNANDDIFVKEALFAAKEECPEAEVRFVNTCKMNIGRCRGCGACSRALEAGKNDNPCIFKDDFQALEEEVRWADCIVVGVPVYTLQPVGQFKDFVDRFSCRHDISAIPWVLDKRKTGEMPGDPNGFDMTRLKERYVMYINVGGATTKDWVSMGCLSAPIFGFSAGMKCVANINAQAAGSWGSPYLSGQLMETVQEAARELVRSYGKPYSEAKWVGDQGICPCCHQRTVALDGGTKVTCPVCGIHGTISIEDGEVKVDFPVSEFSRARGTFKGLREHTTEIQGFGALCGPKLMANKEYLDEQMKTRIKGFNTAINEIGK